MRRGRISFGLAFGGWMAACGPAGGEALRVEGEVVGVEMFLFDQVEGPLLEYPFDRGPVAYVGEFTYEPEAGLALFEISIDSCEVGGLCMVEIDLETGMSRAVPNPTTFRLEHDLFDGVVRSDAAALVVDYTSPRTPERWLTSFNLMLDKITGQGEWRWSEAPPMVCSGNVCAPSVPGASAFATITSFRVVPEPASVALAVAGVLLLPKIWNRRKQRERRGSWML